MKKQNGKCLAVVIILAIVIFFSPVIKSGLEKFHNSAKQIVGVSIAHADEECSEDPPPDDPYNNDVPYGDIPDDPYNNDVPYGDIPDDPYNNDVPYGDIPDDPYNNDVPYGDIPDDPYNYYNPEPGNFGFDEPNISYSGEELPEGVRKASYEVTDESGREVVFQSETPGFINDSGEFQAYDLSSRSVFVNSQGGYEHFYKDSDGTITAIDIQKDSNGKFYADTEDGSKWYMDDAGKGVFTMTDAQGNKWIQDENGKVSATSADGKNLQVTTNADGALSYTNPATGSTVSSGIRMLSSSGTTIGAANGIVPSTATGLGSTIGSFLGGVFGLGSTGSGTYYSSGTTSGYTTGTSTGSGIYTGGTGSVTGLAADSGWNPSQYSSTGLPSSSIYSIIEGIVMWALSIFGFISIIGFVISGIMYLLAAGDETTMKKAKNAMIYSITGVVVGLIGLVIIFAVNSLLSGGWTA